MSVRSDNGFIYLEGNCNAEDAETLLCALEQHPDATVELSRVSKLHLAVVQILFTLRPLMRGRPSSQFLSTDVLEALKLSRDRKADLS